MTRACLVITTLSLLTLVGQAAPPSRVRRPVDIVNVPGEQQLLVANRRSGSISVLDAVRRKVIDEIRVGQQLSALAGVPGSQCVLATDEAAHQLIGLKWNGTRVQVLWRLPVSPYPVAVTVSADGRRGFVGSLWSRRLTSVDLDPAGGPPRVVEVLDLPFAPRRMLPLPGGRLVLAEAFGGRLGLVNAAGNRLLVVRALEAHNIGDLVLSGDGRHLLVPHQLLDAGEATTRGGVHWGGVLLNVVRSVSLEMLERNSEDLRSRLGLDYVGIPDRAAGDPTCLKLAAGGRRVLLLAGVHEVVTSDDGIQYFDRQRVGLGPAALVLTGNGQRAWIANRFSDSVSLVQLKPLKRLAEIPLGPEFERSAVDRGEQLFRDARLSSDGWFSCHSCHTRGHSNGLLNDNFGDDTYGAPKKILSLLGTRDTGPWAWNGGVSRLSDQVEKSIELTMRGPKLSTRQINALSAYLRQLSAAPSLAEARAETNRPAIERGRVLFTRTGCHSCHAPPAYTTPESYDVGLHDQQGQVRFNPPSLRGVSQRGRLFHDNRARDLREVLVRFRHGLKAPLPARERDDLLQFLESL